jgi:hypothetical protein
MKGNINKVDRRLRAVLGIGLILLVFVGPRTPWGWLGLILLVTSAVGWCPLYRLMGWSTRREEFWSP